MKSRTRLSATITALASIVIGAAPAIAQDSRADAIRAQQTSRQQEVRPPEMSAGEKVLDRLERWGYITGAPRGVYPWVGSIYSGGGFAAGAGARQPFGDDGALNVFGGSSISSYRIGQADLALPSFAGNRARITVSGQYLDAPNVAYYGTGSDTNKDDRTRFGYTPTSGGARLDIDVSKRFTVGGEVGYLHIETDAGRTGPSIEQRFTPEDTAGLELSKFRFINSTARAVFDWRKRLGYAGSGGMYRAQFDDYRDRDGGAYSFQSFEAEAVQLIPLVRANWVIALRGLATITDLGDSSQVPFFLTPSIGGGKTIRGYPDFRFRERNRLVMNAELRWTPARFLDMAVFYDAGKVEARREDLNLTDLKDSYGIGMRVIGPKGYAFRIEAANSREHQVRLLLSAGGAF